MNGRVSGSGARRCAVRGRCLGTNRRGDAMGAAHRWGGCASANSEGSSRLTPTSASAGQLNGRYNAWLHTRLWNELIEDVVAWYAFPNVGGVTIAGNGSRRLASAEAQRPIRSTNPLGDPVGNDSATKVQGDLLRGILFLPSRTDATSGGPAAEELTTEAFDIEVGPEWQ
jgi:hypothetical protein